MISLLVPTRERVLLAKRFVDSVVQTVSSTANIEILLYVADNDPLRNQYKEVFTQNAYIDLLTIHTGPELFLGIVWDKLANLSKGDYLYQMEDELVCRTPQWDTRLIESHEGIFHDKIGLTFCNDGLCGSERCNTPLIHRKWRDIVGYFTPPFEHFYNSTTVMDIAKRIGRVNYCPDVLIEHYHWTKTKQIDATTRRHRKDRKNQIVLQDKERYIHAEKDREVAARKLLSFIRETSMMQE